MNLEEGLPNAQLFVVCVVDGHFEDIIHFLTTGTTSKEYFVQQKKNWWCTRQIFLSSQGTYTKWAMMRYCEDMYLNSNEVRFSPKHMGVL